MKRLVYISIAVLMAFVAVSCDKEGDKNAPERLVVNQWYKVTEYGEQKLTDIWDVGVSFKNRLFYHVEMDNYKNGYAADYLYGPFTLETLSDGRVKVKSSDNSTSKYVLFSDITRKSAKIEIVYRSRPSTSDIWHPTEDGGWSEGVVDVLARKPFRKLPWAALLFEEGGKSFKLTAGYGYPGDFNPTKTFIEEVFRKNTPLPIVRMNNTGTQVDFAKVDVRGKIVVVDMGAPIVETHRNAAAGATAVIVAENFEEGEGPELTPYLGYLNEEEKRIPFFSTTKNGGRALDGKNSINIKVITDPDDL